MVLWRHLLIVHFRKWTKSGFKFGCRLRLQLPLKKLTWTRAHLDWAYCANAFWVSCFFFFFFFNAYEQQQHYSCTWIHCTGDKVHCSQDLQPLYSEKKILKMGPTALFTHLKIILLQCFQFSVFRKISYIRMGPTYFDNLTIDYMFFIFLTHMSNFVIIRYYLQYDA